MIYLFDMIVKFLVKDSYKDYLLITIVDTKIPKVMHKST